MFDVQQYVQKDPSERTADTVVIVKIRQEKEPKSFKQLFATWDNNYWKVR